MSPNVSCGVFADFAAPAALPTQHAAHPLARNLYAAFERARGASARARVVVGYPTLGSAWSSNKTARRRWTPPRLR